MGWYPKVTYAEFIADGIPEGEMILPCNCDFNMCKGWVCVSAKGPEADLMITYYMRRFVDSLEEE